MENIIMKSYRYDISNENEKKEYLELKKELKSKWFVLFDSISSTSYNNRQDFLQKITNCTHTLDEDYLFNNQFNTKWVNGKSWFRLFFWSESIVPNRNIKEWYYVSKWYEYIQAKIRNTCRCWYCWKQYNIDLIGTRCNSWCDKWKYFTIENEPLLTLRPL